MIERVEKCTARGKYLAHFMECCNGSRQLDTWVTTPTPFGGRVISGYFRGFGIYKILHELEIIYTEMWVPMTSDPQIISALGESKIKFKMFKRLVE